MKRVSLNRRLAQDASSDGDVEIVLIKISHADLDQPILLSSDMTERLSTEPLIYGTRSAWNNPAGDPFLFLIMDINLPTDQDDAPASAELFIQAVDPRMTEIMLSTREQASVDIAVVTASDPDLVQFEQRGLKLINADGNDFEIKITFSRDPITQEPWPPARLTKQRFPGLHK